MTALIDAIANENGGKGSEYNCIAFKLKKLASYYMNPDISLSLPKIRERRG